MLTPGLCIAVYGPLHTGSAGHYDCSVQHGLKRVAKIYGVRASSYHGFHRKALRVSLRFICDLAAVSAISAHSLEWLYML